VIWYNNFLHLKAGGESVGPQLGTNSHSIPS